MKIGVIITPERNQSKIIKALKEEKIQYEIINLLSDDWCSYFKKDFDGFLIYPPSFPDEWKNLFIKRLYLLKDKLHGRSLPSIESIIMYESKITMHDFYKINNLPHIESHSFINYQEALKYGRNCDLPVVIKENSGSGAIGVKVVKSRRKLLIYIHKSFLYRNSIRKYISLKTIKSSLKNFLYPYKLFIDSNRMYLPKNSKKSGVVHIQSFLRIKYEWRIIRIGDSFFGHKKLEDKKGYHSGSLNKEWGPINKDLLDLVKKWSDELNLESMCFDIFEDFKGNYYINELQALFGTSTSAQLIINDQPGRYIYDKKIGWVFEVGEFARNGCNNLRIKTLLKKIQKIN